MPSDRDWVWHNRTVTSHNRAGSLRVFLSALALGVLLASSVSAQYLEATIMLPDTLGPLNGPYCMTCTDDSAFPRLYVGGAGGFYPGRPPEDSGGVIVANALTCKRLARIPTGPAKALCYVPTHNKLYVASLTADSVRVVDCAANEVVSTIHVAGRVPVMQYDRRYDRLYCGGDRISVVDCVADTVVHTIPVAASVCALDSIHNRLHVGAGGPLSVIDCASDSVVATIPRVRSASALIFNRTAQKVYATTQDSLYAIRTADNSVAAVLAFTGLTPLLACDVQRNRIYCHNDGHWSSIDCTTDTVVFSSSCNAPSFMACDVARNRLIIVVQYTMMVKDASSGQTLARYVLDSWPYGACWGPVIDRFFSLPAHASDPDYQTCLTMSIDCGNDSLFGVIPLTLRADIVNVDSVHNRLYFMYHNSLVGAVGAVDCARNIVTSCTYAGEEPGPMCYNPNNDHLYWTSSNYRGIPLAFVTFDCSTGTVGNRFPLSGWVEKLQMNVPLNKLYVESFESAAVAILVADGACDSVVKRIVVPSGSQVLRLVPADNVLWSLCVHHVVAIDCVGDSIVADALDSLGSIDDACACPEDRRIYAGWFGRPAWIVDMDNPTQVDTLHARIPDVGMRFLDVPGTHKAYWCLNYPSRNGRIFTIDTRTSTLTDSFWIGRQLSGMCLDHTGRYVYGTGYDEPSVHTLVTIDTQGDSVVAVITMPSGCYGPLQLNRSTNRIYPLSSGNPIPVFRDTALIGILDGPKWRSAGSRPIASVVHGDVVISAFRNPDAAQAPVLLDIAGRKTLDLKFGSNDVSGLVPGIYFVGIVNRDQSSSSWHKVVIVK